MHISVEIILKNHYMLILKYIYDTRGTCSSVQMLKGYMARERLGSPGME